ncbi:hypothetical protein HCO69_19600 [Pantoea sp. LS15]|uniref:hypothetical protein n=1 Tax=Enterobacterales TaxID=91347 RepID=UPI000E0ED7A6|nr:MULTISPECIES: hypothetical protein [Enterobacterales]NJQ21818.1 hypothetical protein [Pantoea sp. LS15]NKF48414.1 hypothetical protein [Pantoea sp. LS15]RDK12972.1 hypothetical protein CEJ32_20060 [Enterobacter sp. 9-2]
MLTIQPPSDCAEMHSAKQNFYIESMIKNKKTLVIGCGRKIENGFSSPQLPNRYPCSMNREHLNDVLIDKDERSEPDVVMDFGQWEQMRLDLIAPGHFDRIDFEYLSIHPQTFTETQIKIWLRGADKLLAESGKICFLSGHIGYLEIVKKYFSQLRNYKMICDATRCEPFIDHEGNPLRDRQGRIQEHRYCLVQKKCSWF